MTLAWLYWDPNRFIFTVPFIERPIAWYGLFFVLGFIIGYFIMVRMLQATLRHTQILAERDIESWPHLIETICSAGSSGTPEQKRALAYFSEKTIALLRKSHTSPENVLTKEEKRQVIDALNEALYDEKSAFTRENIAAVFPKAIYSLKDLAMYLTDRLTWFVVAGTLIGARLGHVFFYDWERYRENLGEIVKIWEGGLASHGGAIGVLIAVALYFFFIRTRFPEIALLKLLDTIVIPTSLVCVCIRIGNFFNQEIIGTKSTLPWAVIFGNPYDGGGIYPRHPAQLYEAACYLAIFFLLGWLWLNKREQLKRGFLFGLFFTLAFSSRFLIEFVKTPQGGIVDSGMIQTGQVLSIPFILWGLWLMLRPTPTYN